MDEERHSTRDLLRRAALGYYLGWEPETQNRSRPHEQWIPVNVYETENDVVVVAAMPGVESDNIDIEVHGKQLTLRAAMRGPDQQRRQYVVHEWTYGPYVRTVELPGEVEARSANASHGNGVLVVTLPKAAHRKTVRVPLRGAEPQNGEHVGHHGHGTGGGT